MKPSVVTVSVAEFETECLALFDDLEGGRVARIIITRHGRPVAELTPPAGMAPLFGAHRGSVSFRHDIDLTQPTFAEDRFDAEGGP